MLNRSKYIKESRSGSKILSLNNNNNNKNYNNILCYGMHTRMIHYMVWNKKGSLILNMQVSLGSFFAEFACSF